ncbi:SusC/RagA family TonB-linked outer membrane protein [Puia dinghuensis]|uniref:SusC/RagA family TonB-linked outer membrane protein n=1 Tax=Puia dinghuensis TaxID=1792502 RepID=A0A8J2XT94_9BACT|nr:SusC/RagA family TonB-linked outer membrane protein [Puia dinghuensis]GGB02249.1 SusC/RagA family TonB-linked outer membrane protein [Puia dinghuensis]
MKRLLVCLTTCIFIVAFAYGQKIPIRGTVVNEKGEPLEGVTILLKGRTASALSRPDGRFTINVEDAQKGVLTVSIVGYATQDVPINGQTDLRITLGTSTKDLKDVIVISALGLTKRQKSIGYSSQSIDPDRITEARDVNITDALAGKVSGLQVTTTGQPGSSTRVQIRGENSITGNNQPLWVVDGVPIQNDMGDTRGDNLDYGNGAADLNPDDIASIEVLKGPNAAALYGSRAANGAILVTTKKGKTGDKTLGISLNQNTMWSTISEFPAYQNEYGEGSNGVFVTNNNNIVPGTGAARMGSVGTTWGMPMLGQPYDNFAGQLIPGGYSPQPGNITSFYKPSITNSSNLSISKGDANGSFRLSYQNVYADDVLKNQNIIKRNTVSLSGTRKIDWLTLDTWVLYTNQDTKDRTVRNLDPASPMAAYVYMPRSFNISALNPYVNPLTGNSIALGSANSFENPFWSLYEDKNEDTHNRVIGGITATSRLNKMLSLRLQGATDMDFLSSWQYRELGGLQTPQGSYSNLEQHSINNDYQGLLMFNKQLSGDFNLTANAGAELATNNTLVRSARVAALLVHNMPSILNSNAVPTVSEAESKTNTQSLFGNVTIGFRDWLFVDVTGRNDWSSTLPVNNCSFFYPSVSGSFIFSDFLNNTDLISYGKLRASWAQVGNSAPAQALITPYTYGGIFLGNPYINYTSNNQLNNPNLKPEQTVSREAGIDVTMFHDRISFNGTVYSTRATNQIITAQTAPETGFSTRFINAGVITNKGIELSLNAKVIRGKKFNWNLIANWSMNRNMVVSLAPGVNNFVLAQNLGVYVNAKVGSPYGYLNGNAPYKVGDTTLVQANGRAVVQPNTPLGNFHPDWIGSLGSTFTYAGFDFSILFNVKWHGKIYSASYGRANFLGVTQYSLLGRDAWLLSSVILGENGNEQQGIGQTVGSGVTRYADSGRVKGVQYPNAYTIKVDASGKPVLDKNGRYEPGAKSTVWMNPTTYESDMTVNNTPAITYDASSIKIAEIVFGYTVPQTYLTRLPIRGARIALVGRNFWTLFKHTPQGIDPEAANSSGNAQGIDAGNSFPYAQYGFDLKVNF